MMVSKSGACSHTSSADADRANLTVSSFLLHGRPVTGHELTQQTAGQADGLGQMPYAANYIAMGGSGMAVQHTAPLVVCLSLSMCVCKSHDRVACSLQLR